MFKLHNDREYHKVDGRLCIVPTRSDIDRSRTGVGGWTKAMLRHWGVSWPPPKGWKKALEEQADKTYAGRGRRNGG